MDLHLRDSRNGFMLVYKAKWSDINMADEFLKKD